MKLHGSCHCGAVTFSVEASHPYPFNLCYCSVCRKTAGGGGYAINLGADYGSLKVEGKQFLSVYQATIDGNTSPGQRHFCSICASALWLYDPRWPELVHPFASAIDSDLPVPPERVHMMLASKANWVQAEQHPRDKAFNEYPEESLAQWHQRLGLEAKASRSDT